MDSQDYKYKVADLSLWSLVCSDHLTMVFALWH